MESAQLRKNEPVMAKRWSRPKSSPRSVAIDMRHCGPRCGARPRPADFGLGIAPLASSGSGADRNAQIGAGIGAGQAQVVGLLQALEDVGCDEGGRIRAQRNAPDPEVQQRQ
jgi:hypothetical protein